MRSRTLGRKQWPPDMLNPCCVAWNRIKPAWPVPSRRIKLNQTESNHFVTLCNAFGGIILLAVLVVLLTSNERSQSKTSPDTQEMLQRRLAIAETNLQQFLRVGGCFA